MRILEIKFENFENDLRVRDFFLKIKLRKLGPWKLDFERNQN